MLKYRNVLLLFLFSMGFGKTLLYPSNYVDAFALLVMGVVFSYLEYKNQDKKLAEIEQILKQHQADLSEVKDKISSIKVIQQAKPGALTFRQ